MPHRCLNIRALILHIYSILLFKYNIYNNLLTAYTIWEHFQVSINDKSLDLVGEAIGGVNIGNCPHPCANKPCINGGLCVPINDQYKCNCPLGFENKNCEDRK